MDGFPGLFGEFGWCVFFGFWVGVVEVVGVWWEGFVSAVLAAGEGFVVVEVLAFGEWFGFVFGVVGGGAVFGAFVGFVA